MILQLEDEGLGEINRADPLASQIARVDAEISAGLTNAAAYAYVVPILERWKIIYDSAVKNTANWTPGQKITIRNYYSKLQALRNRCKVAYANAPNDALLDLPAFRSTILEGYRFVSATLAANLYKSDDAAKSVKSVISTVVNAPGSAINWTFEQVLSGLGLPKWFLPVAGIGLGVIAVAHLTGNLATIARLVKGR